MHRTSQRPHAIVLKPEHAGDCQDECDQDQAPDDDFRYFREKCILRYSVNCEEEDCTDREQHDEADDEAQQRRPIHDGVPPLGAGHSHALA